MNQTLTVSEVNKYIKGLLAYDAILSGLWVKGEISNYKRHYTGHLYFTVKDNDSILKCVMFKSSADKLLFEPENGMKVLIKGSVSVFERDGIYQLYAESMKVDGIGDLYAAFEQLKSKLQKEGLFDEALKKPIPAMPHTIGVITSETGSVIRDIINVLTRRFYSITVKLYPCAVQGEEAAGKIARGIEFFNKNKLCDVIIVARGGGSLEDLWPFNEEVLARAVRLSEIPVISGVGHETDFTICDFAADLRAPTPSAAAELAVPVYSDILHKLSRLSERVKNIPFMNLKIKRDRFNNLLLRRFLRDPFEIINERRMQILSDYDKIVKYINNVRKDAENKKILLAAKLDALSPLKILSRGYGAVRDKRGESINSIKMVSLDDDIDVLLRDGILSCRIMDINGAENG